MFITEPTTPPQGGDTIPDDPAEAMIAGLEASGTTLADDSALAAAPPAAAEGEGGEAPADGATPPAGGAPPADASKQDGEGKPVEAAAPALGPDGKPVEATPPADGTTPPAKNEAVEKEIKDLGIKSERTQARFRELSEQVATAAPVMAALKEAGIDAAQLPQVIQRAATADNVVSQIMDTGASPQQYGQTLDYLTLVNRAAAGDEAAATKAFDTLIEELKPLAAMLGREVPGVFDPLAAHPDLQQKVVDGMPREAALETARLRTRDAMGRHQADQRRGADEATAAQQRAISEGSAALRDWEAPKLADPAYIALRPALNAEVAKIRAELPPQHWARATEYAYQALKAQAAAAAPPTTPAAPAKPPVGPVRAGPARAPALAATIPDDPLEAAMAGIREATPT